VTEPRPRTANATGPRLHLAGMVLVTVALVACGGPAATGGPSRTAPRATASPASASAPPTSTPAPSGGLPAPDIVFKAEDCPANEVCRREAVARVTAIPFTTTAVPCRDDGSTCELTLDLYYPASPPAAGAAYPVAVWEPGGPQVPATESVGALLLAGQGVVVVDGTWRQATTFGGGGTMGFGTSPARSLRPGPSARSAAATPAPSP